MCSVLCDLSSADHRSQITHVSGFAYPRRLEPKAQIPNKVILVGGGQCHHCDEIIQYLVNINKPTYVLVSHLVQYYYHLSHLNQYYAYCWIRCVANGDIVATMVTLESWVWPSLEFTVCITINLEGLLLSSSRHKARYLSYIQNSYALVHSIGTPSITPCSVVPPSCPALSTVSVVVTAGPAGSVPIGRGDAYGTARPDRGPVRVAVRLGVRSSEFGVSGQSYESRCSQSQEGYTHTKLLYALVKCFFQKVFVNIYTIFQPQYYCTNSI